LRRRVANMTPSQGIGPKRNSYRTMTEAPAGGGRRDGGQADPQEPRGPVLQAETARGSERGRGTGSRDAAAGGRGGKGCIGDRKHHLPGALSAHLSGSPAGRRRACRSSSWSFLPLSVSGRGRYRLSSYRATATCLVGTSSQPPGACAPASGHIASRSRSESSPASWASVERKGRCENPRHLSDGFRQRRQDAILR
jgi:hypothetical protein